MQIQFIDLSDLAGLQTGDVYQMVESTVYFEAYRHILEGLIEVDPENLPLQVILRNLQLNGYACVFFLPSALPRNLSMVDFHKSVLRDKSDEEEISHRLSLYLKTAFFSLLQSLQIRLSSKNINKLTNKLSNWLTGEVKGTLNKTEYFRG